MERVESSNTKHSRLGRKVGAATAAVICALSGVVNTPREAEQAPVVSYSVDAVILNGSDEYNGGYTPLQVESDVRVAAENIAFASGKTRILEQAAVSERIVLPEGVRRPETQEEPCYTDAQLEAVAQQARAATQLGSKAVITVIPNDYPSCDTSWAGLAFINNPEEPTIYIQQALNNDIAYVMTHELGHIVPGGSLGHQEVFYCEQNDEAGERMRLYQAGPVQELVVGECGTSEKDNLVAGEMSSHRTVMSSFSDNLHNNKSTRPAFSPPEIARMDASRQVLPITGETRGRYYVSYNAKDTFGLELVLPQEHALRKRYPDAHSVFFGLTVQGAASQETVRDTMAVVNPENSFSVEPYIIIRSGDLMETMVIDTALSRELPTKQQKKERQSMVQHVPGKLWGSSWILDNPVVYADTEIGLLVQAGTDPEKGYYFDVMGFDELHAQIALAEAERVVEERNTLLAEIRREKTEAKAAQND